MQERQFREKMKGALMEFSISLHLVMRVEAACLDRRYVAPFSPSGYFNITVDSSFL